MYRRPLSRALCIMAFASAVVVPTLAEGSFDIGNCNDYIKDDKDEWNLIPLYYHDDDTADDIPNDLGSIVEGFETENAYYIGNEKLGTLTDVILRAQMCLQKEGDRPVCADLSAGTYTYRGELPGFPGSVSQLVKQIATLSGQASKNADSTVASVNPGA